MSNCFHNNTPNPIRVAVFFKKTNYPAKGVQIRGKTYVKHVDNFLLPTGEDITGDVIYILGEIAKTGAYPQYGIFRDDIVDMRVVSGNKSTDRIKLAHEQMGGDEKTHFECNLKYPW
jgi:hypothetical protein